MLLSYVHKNGGFPQTKKNTKKNISFRWRQIEVIIHKYTYRLDPFGYLT